MSGENTEHRAFPTNTPFTNPEDRGMTLRDWFAGQVMAGIIANQCTAPFSVIKSAVAERAYELADAMMEARKK